MLLLSLQDQHIYHDLKGQLNLQLQPCFLSNTKSNGLLQLTFCVCLRSYQMLIWANFHPK